MKAHAAERIPNRRRRAPDVPLAVFHAPAPGADLDLFSDRMEDLAEYEAIVHEFEALHDGEEPA